MDRPLEVAFHNMPVSAAAEDEIRQHVERLEKRFGHLIGCRVSVEMPHQQHRTGNVCQVHITMHVPGKDLVVSQEPHHLRENRANPDIHSCIRDAFKTAERQLESYKGHVRGGAAVASPTPIAGRVVQIEPGADHGFLLNSTGSQLYFHRDAVTDGRFEDLSEGDTVQYVETEGDSGPTATKVRIGAAARKA